MSPKRLPLVAVAAVASALSAASITAADWPTYKHDANRSSVTNETLDFPLNVAWSYQTSQPPMPAWPEPGKELHRMDFDYAFQPAVAGGMVYFGSSADDTVRALDLATGELAWRFTTGGPIRFAPTILAGRAYVASDDGWLYCLDAKTGTEVWRFHGAPADDLLLGNGRMISRWPCRTGALVVDDVVYFTAGMWPTEGVYVYGLEADTGKELWCNDSSGELYLDLPHPGAMAFDGVAPQGYLLVDDDTLLVATGRCVPAAFDRHTGKLLYHKPAQALYHGAAWLTSGGGLYFNAKNRFQNPSDAHIGQADPAPGDGLFAYSFVTGEVEFTLGGKYRLLADDEVLYTVGGGEIQALELEQRDNGAIRPKKARWTTKHQARVYCLAMAGGTLLTGDRGSITAFDSTTGKQVWRSAIEGEVRGLAVSDGRLIAATERGRLLCFETGEALAKPQETAAPTAPTSPSGPQRATATRLVEASGKRAGYALVVGEPDGRLAEALAVQTELCVVGLLPAAADLGVERSGLVDRGTYGSRVWLRDLTDPTDPADRTDPTDATGPPYFADLVVVSAKAPSPSPAECYRALRPCGGTLCFVGFSEAQMHAFARDAGVPDGELRLGEQRIVRGPLPGAGEWRYPWADGGRSGIGKDTRVQMPLELLWFGGPGPDRLMDRHWMGSPPVSANGRVFMCGQHHVIAFDAYNGRELWSTESEWIGRKYSQYYSSNLVADGDSVYAAKEDTCLRFDQETGEILTTYRVPASVVQSTPLPVLAAGNTVGHAPPIMSGADPNLPDLTKLIWGYVSVADDLVLGSYAVPIVKGQPAESHLVWRSESKAVFALDKEDGSLRWVYRSKPDRTVSNIEIAFGDGKLFLLDATSKADSISAKRRGEEPTIQLDLVALELATGKELWRQPDVPALRDRSLPTRLDENPSHLFMGLPNWSHLVYAKGVVVLGANAAYDAATGKVLWKKTVRPQKLSVVLGNWLLSHPLAFDLRTGEQRMTTDLLTGAEVPWRYARTYGCGPVHGCENLLFFRSGSDGFFDLNAEGTANFGGVRPDCSRSLLAAHGLLIHPEGYSGCGCSYNYQTSLALAPAPDERKASHAKASHAKASHATWYVFPRRATSGAIKHLAVNFGAPGDRRDVQGVPWLGFPRPMTATACPAPVTVLMEGAECYHRPRAARSIKGTDTPWLYTSGLRGTGKIVIDLNLQPNLPIPTLEAAPTLDGKLDDPCWADAPAVPFVNSPFSMLGANVELRVFRDAEHLFLGYQRKPLPNPPREADEATLGRSDAFEVYVTDSRKKRDGIHLGVRRDGNAFATLGIVDRYRNPDPKWKGEWQHALQNADDEWTAEVAVPLKTLTDAGINTKTLQLNCMSRNLTRSGLEAIFLVDPVYGADFKRCIRFRRLIDPPATSPKERTFTVRLHFAEVEGVETAPNQFSVSVQGKAMAVASGAEGAASANEFRGVKATDQVTIELGTPATGQGRPAICAVELLEEPTP